MTAPGHHCFTIRNNRPPILHVVLDSVSHADFPTHRRWPGHVHRSHELILPEAGTYRCRIGDHSCAAAPGQMLLVQPGDVHEDPLATPVRYLACTFHLTPGRERQLLAPGGDPALRTTASDPSLHARLAAALPGGDPWAWQQLDAALAQHLYAWLGRLPAAAVAPQLRHHLAIDRAAQRITEVFARHREHAVPLTVLADELGLSPRAFADACRRHLGQPPRRAYEEVRMAHAAALLAHTGMGVAQVAAQLGFANPFHFSRVYKRCHGHPPST